MSSRRNFLIFGIYAFIFGSLLTFYLLTINYYSKFPEKTDFYKFYKSAGFFIEGKSIYTPVPFSPPAEYLNKLSEKARATLKTFHPNLNSPFHTLFMLPLGVMPFREAFWVWSLLSLFLGLLAVGLIEHTQPFHEYQTPIHGVALHREEVVPAPISTGRNFGGDPEKHSISLDQVQAGLSQTVLSGWLDTHSVHLMLLWIILLGYYPTWVNFQTGQFGLFLIGLIGLVWLTSRKGECQLAGLILGLAISLKIFMGLFLIFFAVRQRWKILIWAMSTFIFCNLISLITFGLSAYKQHLSLIALSSLYINSTWNASFSAFFTRIFGGAENIPLIALPMVAYGLAYSLSFLLTLGLIWVAWSRPQELSPLRRFDVGFSLTIVAMFLISPFGWMYYFPALIIPLLVMWYASSALNSTKLYKVLLAAAWILSSIPTTLINSEETALNQPIIWFTSGGYYFYALIAICGLIFAISHRLHAREKFPLKPA
jgi:hypothetical protein